MSMTMIAPSALPAKHNFFLMAKPPEEVRDQISALLRTSRSRPYDLLHMTLQPVALGWLPTPRMEDMRNAIPKLCEAIDAFSIEVTLNRIFESSSAVTLRGTVHGASDFHAAICAGLRRDSMPLIDYRFAPHVTLSYKPDGLGHEFIEPIHWTVTEFLLIESVVGETRHIELGRWPLRPRQGELFG
jgi:2'-5' RNA ligase